MNIFKKKDEEKKKNEETVNMLKKNDSGEKPKNIFKQLS